ncbi:MAG TPA: hypothetical protein VGF91_26770 [Solirubrobacteraceae bacterium]|jgi:hypothetical protein
MVLAFALRRLAESSLAVLFAIRGSGAAGLADDGLVPPGSVTRLALGPLTPAALGPLLADRVLPRLSRPALVRIHAAAGGNPLFALEIAREFDQLPAVGSAARLPVPSGVREFLADRVPRLPAEASEALLAAAALSRPTVRLVEQASSASGLLPRRAAWFGLMATGSPLPTRCTHQPSMSPLRGRVGASFIDVSRIL